MEARNLGAQQCVERVVHAFHCTETNCRLPGCHRIKKAIQHTKGCKNKNCPTSKHLIAHCCYHAKHCKERQQQLIHRLLQPHLLSKRMARMSITGGEGSGSEGSLNRAAVNPGGAGPSALIGPQPTHQSLGLEPVSQTPASILQAVKQEEASRQEGSQTIPSYPENVAPQLQAMPPPGQQVPNLPFIPSVEPWTPKYQSHIEMPQPPRQSSGGEGAMPPGAATVVFSTKEKEILAMNRQAKQQLLRALKVPISTQQQKQILDLLKSNPQLMDFFIKHRQEYATKALRMGNIQQ